MTKRPIDAVWMVGLSLPLIACLSPRPAWADVTMDSDIYDCARGAMVQATYINSDEASFAVILVEGQQVGMDAVQSASGAKYAQFQEDAVEKAGYVWWTKGDEAFLLWVDPATGTDDMIVRDCKAR